MDERALQESVSNVIDNALKFVHLRHFVSGAAGGAAGEEDEEGEGAGAGSELWVDIHVREALDPDDGCVGVDIVVTDNGPGFAEDEVEGAFGRGWRGTSSV